MQGTRRLISGVILATVPLMSGGWWFGRSQASDSVKNASASPSQNGVKVEALLQKAGIQYSKDLSPEPLEGSQELLIRFTAAKPLKSENQLSSSPASMGIVSRRNFQESMKVKRGLKVSSNKWIVAAIGSHGELRHWTLIADPLVLRAESPGPDGLLSGQVLQRQEAEFLVSIPDDPSIRQLKLFRPRWTGQEYELEVMGIVSLP